MQLYIQFKDLLVELPPFGFWVPPPFGRQRILGLIVSVAEVGLGLYRRPSSQLCWGGVRGGVLSRPRLHKVPQSLVGTRSDDPLPFWLKAI